MTGFTQHNIKTIDRCIESFTYDGDGNRIRKAGANDSVDYTVIDGVIYAEKRQAGVTNTLHYLFDENNVYPGGKTRGGKAPYPKIPVL